MIVFVCHKEMMLEATGACPGRPVRFLWRSIPGVMVEWVRIIIEKREMGKEEGIEDIFWK